MEKFKALGLSENVLSALEKKGWEEPSPIQEKTIPLLLSGLRDIVGQAQTGTGKTAAFGLPLIEKLDENNKNVQALILAPTRELAVQVAEEINSFKGSKKLFVLPIYGGQSYELQFRGLKKGAQIVVGTPGRIQDHIDRKSLILDHVTHVVLDEADEMLNMGFQEEVEKILSSVPAERRMLLFSATMPAEILRLAKRYMRDYDLVEVKKEQLTTELTEQIYFEVRNSDRFEALCRIIDAENEFYGIVFCRTKVETDEVARHLSDRGYDSEALHGDVTQNQREMILKKFKARKATILVATDVAARGIDVNDLTHVINYQLPQDPEAYVHRIGRTGRAGKQGTAITLITPAELRSLLYIQKIARATIKKEKLPEVKDVVQNKKNRIKVEIQGIIDSGEYNDYISLAHDLIDDGNTAERALAALLKYTFKDELNEDSYRDISNTGARSVDQKGTARLFVALGRMQNYTPPKLVKFLEEEGGVDQRKINDVKVFDNFSFITVPFAEAEILQAVFSKYKGSPKPLVTKAKDRDSGGGSGGGSYGDKPRKSFGDKPRKSFGDRKFDKPREEKSFDKPREEKSFDKPRTEKSFDKPREEKTFDKPRKTFAKSEGGEEKKPVKRTNKNTDYLDNKTDSPKPSTKKEGLSKTEELLKSFDDDLSW
jgi:ATP-dependent RNA helicase DeaD